MAPGRIRLVSVVLIVLAAAGLVFTHEIWLGALGRYLVKAEQPDKADIAVVLAGDGFGHRIMKGAELAKQGFVQKVLVSGPPGMYGHNECDLAIPYIVKRGYPENWFIHLHTKVFSTREEARAVVAELRKRGVKRVLLVTSDYHTRRAGSVFREMGVDMEFRIVSVKDEFFRAETWWQSRQGQKVFLLEWAKTVADWFGI